MKFEFILLMISLYIKDGNYQRFTPNEMNNIIETVVRPKFEKADYDEAKRCWSIQQEKWFPHIQYAYQGCLLRDDDQPEVVNNYFLFYLHMQETFWIELDSSIRLDQNIPWVLNQIRNQSFWIQKINDPDLVICYGFDCWESQLTDVTRFEIINIMNTYRQRVAEGSCVNCKNNTNRAMIELRWASYLEKIAVQILYFCSRSHYAEKEIDYNENPKFNKEHVKTKRETVIVSFATITGLQREMRLILWDLMSNNHLKDWSSSGQFRRNGATDVGCAYLVRRHVSINTALNENVTNGNVGYLSCVYDTPIHNSSPSFLPLTYFEKPTLKDCQSILYGIVDKNEIVFDQPLNYYYPLLCHILTNGFPNQSHIFCERLESQNSVCKNPLYQINEKTWQEKLYGIKIMTSRDFSKKILQCNIPEDLPLPEREQSETILNYNCTLKKELFVNPDPRICSNWACTDSQLTDITKVRILNALNTARHALAMGKCPTDVECHPLMQWVCSNKTFCNMAKLWHWFLELKANLFIRSCPNKELVPVKLDDGPFKGPVVYKIIGTMFELPMDEGQLALERAVWQLFWTNGFQDWPHNGSKEFLHGNMQYIGCAAVFRPNITVDVTTPLNKLKDGITTHLACSFAALSNRFFTTPGRPDDESCCQKCQPNHSLTNICETNHVKNVQPFPNLCTSNIFEVTMTCQINSSELCSDGSKSKAWESIYDGSTVYQEVSGKFQKKERYKSDSFFQPKWPGWYLCPLSEPSSSLSEPSPSLSEPSPTTFVLSATPDPEIESFYRKKYCWVLILFFLMLTALLALLLSLLFKYGVEKKIFDES